MQTDQRRRMPFYQRSSFCHCLSLHHSDVLCSIVSYCFSYFITACMLQQLTCSWEETMTTSESTNVLVLTSNHSLLGNTTSQNSTSSSDICAGAGTYSDGSCRVIWPFWVEVTVPLCCIVFFLLTLTIVFLRPFGNTVENDSSKQRLNSDDTERTERDQGMSYTQSDKTSLDTKV